MLPAAGGAMQRTMAELGASDQVQTRFTAAIVAAPTDSPEDRSKLIRYIERYGKGRFAQRLAAHLDDVDPPDYIAQALTRLRDKLAHGTLNLISGLNDQQRQAVLHDDHTVVVAGPGSGKTATLATKVAHLLDREIDDPFAVACLTYNNDTVREIALRLRAHGAARDAAC
jgi:hypothetical protein